MSLSTLRVGVRAENGNESMIWRLWAELPGDVYVAVRSMGGVFKFSLHASGICRNAFTAEHAAKSASSNRLLYKWRRTVTPPAGSGQVASALVFAIPTDFLSAPQTNDGKVHWIPAAPDGDATFIRIAFAREPEVTIRALWAGSGKDVVRVTELAGDERLCVLSHHGPWDNEDLVMPANGGPQELLFRHADSATGRPIRMFFGGPPNDGDELRLIELGGWARPASTAG